MEYKLFREFVQTFLAERKDFISGSGEIVLTPEALEECIDRFIENPITDPDQKFDQKLSRQFVSTSRETKIVFAHASWLYVHASMAMTADGKRNAVGMSLLDMPDYRLRDDIFLHKGGIANPGTAYGTMKYWNMRFILYLFKWIKSSQAGGDVHSIIKAIIGACLYAVYDDESYLNEPFGAGKARQIIADMGNTRTKNGDLPRLGICNFLLNLCNPDYYERIVSYGDKKLIAERLYQEGYGSREGLNTDDVIHLIKRHLMEQHPEIDPQFLLYDEAVRPFWQNPKPETNSYWLFQCNPKVYDIVSALRGKSVARWRVASHAKEIRIGDKVILWVTGERAGCYALGEVSGEIEYGVRDIEEQEFYIDSSYNVPSDRVRIKLTHNLVDKPILKQRIEGNPEFDGFKAGLQGTNFSATRRQYNALVKMALDTMNRGTNIVSEPQKSEPVVLSSHPLNLILFGPPGTGKTYSSINLAVQIADPDFTRQHGIDGDRVALTRRYRELVDEGRIVFITFHQSMSYEDFIEGIKPVTNEHNNGTISYEIISGIFKRLCGAASFFKRKPVLKPGSDKGFGIANPGSKGQQFSQQYDAYWKTLPIYSKSDRSSEILYTMRNNPFEVFRNSNRPSIIVCAGEKRTPLVISKNELVNVFNEEKHPVYASYENILINRILELHGVESESLHEDIKESGNMDKGNFVLIIDEINRCNVSQIFGELITLIEPDKRAGMPEALEAVLPYSKEKFSVPENLHIIATMNTADRSVEALDTALRRRFSFREMIPEYDLLEDAEYEGINLGTLLKTINQRIEGLLDKDHAIGHSYFLRVAKGEISLKQVFFNEIIPLLQEYFYGNFGRLELVLGKGFVKSEQITLTIYATPSADNDDFNDHVRYSLVRDQELNETDFQNALRILLKESNEI